ncbi:acetate--CoA ligase family protein [Desulfovibrio oxyclinae]|uniref:acetate--CoA ligase family protein n=1 Tax=Desulfovibrio oxyclinae TaxID=63560 RepID=UPI00037C9767|nr:acetate--CoA ligase [Desulfovibrio oxyclinae]
MAKPSLEPFFNPETVAVVGASSTPGKVGHTVMENMLSAGFRGKLLPVNPKGGDIMGVEAVTSVEHLPRGVDLAVVAVPRRFVIDTARELASIGCRSVIVITAGFKEVGHKGYDLEQELAGICRDADMALLGPNCLGMINSPAGVNASFAAGQPLPGNIAFFSQSGALCVAILDWARGAGIGFSKFVSLGNKALMDEADMLRYLDSDPETDVILGYVENVENGKDFLLRAETVTRNKPVIMIKSGSTAAGAKAASSHTGAIAGSDSAYGTAFRKAGVIRVRDVESLFNLALAFSEQPLPKGPNVGIVTNSGGPGILAADDAVLHGLSVPSLTPRTVMRLQEFLPGYAAFNNPVDIIGDADAERYAATMEVVAEDPTVHSLLVMLTPTAAVGIEDTAKAVARTAERCGKPVFASFIGGRRVGAGRKILREAGIPCYDFPAAAVESIYAMHSHAVRRHRPQPEYLDAYRDVERARKVLRESAARGEREVVEFRAQEVASAYGLDVPGTLLARSSEEAVRGADAIGYPVALKIASPQISHKTDVDGVAVGLKNAEAVAEAFSDITSRATRMRPDAYIAGCLVQEMAPAGSREVIVGFKRDDQFGPLLMFGLGGVYVEIVKDVALRLAPLSKQDAFEIVREIRSYLLLKGIDGGPYANFDKLEEVILTMSRLAVDLPEVLEAEFNPVLVGPERAVVADVRITLDPKVGSS